MSVVNELWTYRGLVYNLAERDLRSRYRRSLLGWTWSLINPAATLAIYTLVFGTFLGGQPPPAGNPDASYFALYLFAAPAHVELLLQRAHRAASTRCSAWARC